MVILYNIYCNDFIIVTIINIGVMLQKGVSNLESGQSYQRIASKLASSKIRASHHRIKVLEYLIQNPCHPTVDQIYIALHEEIPSLSRTTVYNTLSTFQKAGLVRELAIDDHEARYDIMTENHGHFKCESCGTIYNFAMELDSWMPEELENFQIRDKNTYFKGICASCLSQTKDTM